MLTTNARRSYLEALLAFADEPRSFPATPFAQRRHLFTRTLSASKEARCHRDNRWFVRRDARGGHDRRVLMRRPLFHRSPPRWIAPPRRRRRPAICVRTNPWPATTREASLQAAVTAGGAEPSAWLELATLQEQRGATALAEATLLAMRRALPGRTRQLCRPGRRCMGEPVSSTSRRRPRGLDCGKSY